jgi:hypothetical protein
MCRKVFVESTHSLAQRSLKYQVIDVPCYLIGST